MESTANCFQARFFRSPLVILKLYYLMFIYLFMTPVFFSYEFFVNCGCSALFVLFFYAGSVFMIFCIILRSLLKKSLVMKQPTS